MQLSFGEVESEIMKHQRQRHNSDDVDENCHGNAEQKKNQCRPQPGEREIPEENTQGRHRNQRADATAGIDDLERQLLEVEDIAFPVHRYGKQPDEHLAYLGDLQLQSGGSGRKQLTRNRNDQDEEQKRDNQLSQYPKTGEKDEYAHQGHAGCEKYHRRNLQPERDQIRQDREHDEQKTGHRCGPSLIQAAALLPDYIANGGSHEEGVVIIFRRGPFFREKIERGVVGHCGNNNEQAGQYVGLYALHDVLFTSAAIHFAMSTTQLLDDPDNLHRRHRSLRVYRCN